MDMAWRLRRGELEVGRVAASVNFVPQLCLAIVLGWQVFEPLRPIVGGIVLVGEVDSHHVLAEHRATGRS